MKVNTDLPPFGAACNVATVCRKCSKPLQRQRTDQNRKKVFIMESKRLAQLYKLLERAEREHDTEAVAALRWAIYELENS